MGKLIDLEERRQVQRLRRAMLDRMSRLVRLGQRYREALQDISPRTREAPLDRGEDAEATERRDDDPQR